MPRNRMIKPDFWNDEKLGKEPEAIQLTFIGTWNFSDDYGVVRANPVWLKNQIFPYKEHLRIDAFLKWLEALERMEMLIKFTVRGEKYYFIRTFRLHQSVEKPSKSRNCTEEELQIALSGLGFEKQQDNSWQRLSKQSGSSRVVVGDEVKGSVSEDEVKRPIGLVVAKPTTEVDQKILKSEFKELTERLTGNDLKTVVGGLKEFLITKRPFFIEPYQEYWNLFAKNYNLSEVVTINDMRQKKFKSRIHEPPFDFIKIMEKIKASRTLKGIDTNSTWKVNFDWIFENQSNYVKVLEGNYDGS